jgi:hypothetical protein
VAGIFRYHTFPVHYKHTTFYDIGYQVQLLKFVLLGNVTYVCPGFHGGFAIPADPGAFNHTPSFATAAGTSKAHELAINTAKGMAIAGWSVLFDDDVAEKVKNEFEADKKERELLALN